jgi:hypothetical protein
MLARQGNARSQQRPVRAAAAEGRPRPGTPQAGDWPNDPATPVGRWLAV